MQLKRLYALENSVLIDGGNNGSSWFKVVQDDFFHLEPLKSPYLRGLRGIGSRVQDKSITLINKNKNNVSYKTHYFYYIYKRNIYILNYNILNRTNVLLLENRVFARFDGF